MAVVWLIVELIMVFFYFDLPNVMSKNDDDLCVSTDNSVNSDRVVKCEKQKLTNINGSYRKRRRTNSVMDDWHLAKGWFTLCPGGGGVLKEFLGGDVPLGPWNP